MRKFPITIFGIFVISSLLIYYGDMKETDTSATSNINSESSKYFLEEKTIKPQFIDNIKSDQIETFIDLKDDDSTINLIEELPTEKEQLDLEIGQLKGKNDYNMLF